MRMVEHVFITSLPWQDIRTILARFLPRVGLRLVCTCIGCGGERPLVGLETLDDHCSVCQQPRKLAFWNGVEPRKAYSTGSGHPLWIALEHNRGRVEMSGALQHKGTPTTEHDAVLRFFPEALEAVLARGGDENAVARKWLALPRIDRC
jgi:hypothetical protein